MPSLAKPCLALVGYDVPYTSQPRHAGELSRMTQLELA